MIVSILIGVGAVAIVIGTAIRSYYKRKRGETGCSCGNCSGCSGCSQSKREEESVAEEQACDCGCHSHSSTEEK